MRCRLGNLTQLPENTAFVHFRILPASVKETTITELETTILELQH
jgi:hypothetical protein